MRLAGTCGGVSGARFWSSTALLLVRLAGISGGSSGTRCWFCPLSELESSPFAPTSKSGCIIGESISLKSLVVAKLETSTRLVREELINVDGGGCAPETRMAGDGDAVRNGEESCLSLEPVLERGEG